MKAQNSTKKLLLLIIATSISVPAAFAQREAPDRQENREERRRRMQDLTPEQRQQRMQERLNTMTPEQRQRFEERRNQMQQMQRQEQLASVSGEDRQKYLMSSAGVEDPPQQNTIIAFVMEQAARRQTVTEAATQLSAVLADKAASPEAVSAALARLSTASKEFRTWKEGALKTLDAKVDYSNDPRLKSLLVLVGIVGDEAADAGGFNAIFPGGLAGGADITTLLPPVEGGWGGMGGGGRGGGENNPQPAAETPAAPANN